MTGQLVSITEEPQRLTLAVQITFAILSVTAVVLRFLARRARQVEIQWDDYSIVIAEVLCLGLIACDMTGTLYCGVGLHVTDVIANYGPDRLVVFLKVLIPVQILWAASLAATKISILLLYIRIFNTPAFQRTAKIVAVIIFLWCLSVILCSFLLCTPFAFNWDQTIPDGHCGDRVLSYIVTGVLNIVTDVLVLCMPMPVIWKLQMRRASKVALVGIFTVGFFICIVSIIRLKSLVSVDYVDITHSVPSALIWSMIEPSVGIILACLPTIRVLFPAMFGTNSKRSGDSDRTPAGPYQRHQALDEYPLTPVIGKPGMFGHNAVVSGRVVETRDSDSNTSYLENASRHVQREGPLNRSQEPDKIVVTQEWEVR